MAAGYPNNTGPPVLLSTMAVERRIADENG
jgi:hypothetical protein